MEARHISGLPGMVGGFSTFSWKAMMRLLWSTSMTPNALASRFGIGMTATVASPPFSMWKLTIWRTSIL
jgi:hypothetical protein